MKLRTYLRPAALLLPLLSPASARAATMPLLGTAGTFAVLAGSTVTNTGPITVIGGVSAGHAPSVAPACRRLASIGDPCPIAHELKDVAVPAARRP